MRDARNVVFHTPATTANIQSLLRAAGLVAKEHTQDDIRAAVEVRECRAIVLDVPDVSTNPRSRRTLLGDLEHLAHRALDRGIAVVFALTSPGGQAQEDAQRALADRDLVFRGRDLTDLEGYAGPRLSKPSLVSVGPDVGWQEIADLCRDHNPGRWLGEVHIDEHPKGRRLSDERRLLLRRAFNDVERVSVRHLEGDVYRVHPCRNGHQLSLVYIAKFVPPGAFNKESGAHELCAKTTPFPYLPPVAPTRCLGGQTTAVLVSHFVDRAVQFEEYIASHSPSLAIAALYDGPLRCWQVGAQRRGYKLGEYLLQKKIVSRDPGKYVRTYSALQAAGASCSHPNGLLAKLEAVPEMDVFACMVHGDLHVGNLRVRDNTAEVVLIDFARFETEAPVSRDPAELEVSLAFKPKAGETHPPLTNEELQQLYSPPLLTFHNLGRNASARALAIEQIRRQVASLVSEAEYRAMVAGHCMYYAGRVDLGSVATAAYRIADALL